MYKTHIGWDKLNWIQITYESEYYTNRAKLRKKHTNLSVRTDVLK